MKADKRGYYGYSVETEDVLILATDNYKDALKTYLREKKESKQTKPHYYISLKGWMDEDRIETDLLRVYGQEV